MVNKVILIGNVGKDPDVKHLDSGVSVANFPLATSENYKNKEGERVTKTEWHNIVAWRGLADVVDKYVQKGKQLYIEGRLRSRSYDDKDGVKKYITEIFADNLQMLGRKGDADNSKYESQPSAAESGNSDNGNDFSSEDTDDLPF